MQFQSIKKLAYQTVERDRQRAHVARYGDPVPATVTRFPQPPDQWHPSKQLALLMIYRSACAHDCISHMSGSGIRARQEDFLALRQMNIAFKRPLARFHELTPVGKRYAHDCARTMATKLGLHHIESYHFGGTHRAKCTCGWSQSASDKYGLTESQIAAAIARHRNDPDEWKRQRERTLALIESFGDQMTAATRNG